MVELKVLGTSKGSASGFSLSEAKKTIAVQIEKQSGKISLTNEYGNTIEYSLEASAFQDLFSSIWQFVKERQH